MWREEQFIRSLVSGRDPEGLERYDAHQSYRSILLWALEASGSLSLIGAGPAGPGLRPGVRPPPLRDAVSRTE